MPNVFPKIAYGVFSNPSEVDELSFDYNDLRLKLFYDQFLEALRRTYIAQAEMASWFYVVQKAGPAMIVSAVAHGLRLVDQEKRLQASKQLEAATKIDFPFRQNLEKTLDGIGLQIWSNTDMTNFLRQISNMSALLASVYAVYKVQSVLEARVKAQNFMSYFSNHNELMIVNNAARNIAEYMTFRFQPLILRLRDDKQIEHFSKHMLKNLIIALMEKPYLEATTKDLCDQIIQGALRRISKENEALWRRKPYWFWGSKKDKCLQLMDATTGQVNSISYEKAIFNAPILFVYKRKDDVLYDEYVEPREFAKTAPEIPAQMITSAKELNHMGFKMRSRL